MMKSTILMMLATLLHGCSGAGTDPTSSTSGDTGGTSSSTGSSSGGTGQFKLEAWADNWFSMSIGDKLVVEDSVPITTERSFNSETALFDADYPMTLSFVLKDFKQDDTGLEYIGTDKQQIGDGGFIAQITDTKTGSVVAVSSAAWKCKVIHKAPTNPACEKDPDPEATCLSEIADEPSGWRNAGYDVSAWASATEYTAAAVGPKEGYNDITWNLAAKLIWTSDLKLDNTLLCKVTIESP